MDRLFNGLMNKKNIIEIIIFFLIVPILLFWPAIYNESPIMFSDSRIYLEEATGISWRPNRPSYYPYLAISGPLLGSTFITIIIQACIVTFLLYILLIKLNNIRPAISILLVGILTILTPLSWWISSLMAEFILVVTLTFFSLVVLNKWKNWTITEKTLTVLVFLFSLIMHVTYTYSILTSICFVIVVQALVIRRVENRNWLILGLAIFAVFSFPVLNVIKGYPFSSSDNQSSTYKLLIARITGDGIITEDDLRWFLKNELNGEYIENRVARLRNINRNRPEVPNKITSRWISRTAYYAALINSQNVNKSPFYAWDVEKYMSYKDMVYYLIKNHPVENVTAIVKGTYRLWTFPYMPAFMNGKKEPGEVLKIVSPLDFSKFNNSKIATNNLDILVTIFDPLFAFFYSISLLSSLIAIIYSGILAWKTRSFTFFENNTIGISLMILFVLLIHSFLIYTVGGDYTRYGSRVAIAVDVAGWNLMINAFLIYKSRKEINGRICD